MRVLQILSDDSCGQTAVHTNTAYISAILGTRVIYIPTAELTAKEPNSRFSSLIQSNQFYSYSNKRQLLGLPMPL